MPHYIKDAISSNADIFQLGYLCQTEVGAEGGNVCFIPAKRFIGFQDQS